MAPRPIASRERLLQLLDRGRESEDLDFKGKFGGETQHYIFIAKDVAAMQSLPDGGDLVFGADDYGRPTRQLDDEGLKKLDEAEVRQQLVKYLPEPIPFEIGCWEIENAWLALLSVGPSPSGYVTMRADGQWSHPSGKRGKTEFRTGEAYVRRSTSSAVATEADLDRIRQRLNAADARRRRRRWLVAAVPALALAAVATVLLLARGSPGSPETAAAGADDLPASKAGVNRDAFAVSGSNPLPARGSPHGRGITHADYPHGYRLDGEYRPTINSYLDNERAAPLDERRFLGACVVTGSRCRPPTGERLIVSPGDRLIVSAYLHNNAGAAGNDEGSGSSVARNVRLYVNFPTDRSTTELPISTFVFAENAVVDRDRPKLKTISDNLTLYSASDEPIRLDFLAGKARLLQARPARSAASGQLQGGGFDYQEWLLTPRQEYWLFTGKRRGVAGNAEQDPGLGLPIGSDGAYSSRTAVGTRQSDHLRYFGGFQYHAFVQFQIRVAASGRD